MNCHIAIQKPYLYSKNVSVRMLSSRANQIWTLNDWAQVEFNDESWSTVRPVKNSLLFRRHRGM